MKRVKDAHETICDKGDHASFSVVGICPPPPPTHRGAAILGVLGIHVMETWMPPTWRSGWLSSAEDDEVFQPPKKRQRLESVIPVVPVKPDQAAKAPPPTADWLTGRLAAPK